MTTVKKHEAKKIAVNDPVDDAAMDLGYVEERPPLIPEGTYAMGFRRASKRFKAFGHDNMLLYFQIVTPGELFGVELYMALRVSPRKGCTAMAASSKLARAWTVAMGHPPTRRDRLSTAQFKGKEFRVLVGTVAKDPNRIALPLTLQYSVIVMLLEKTAGA